MKPIVLLPTKNEAKSIENMVRRIRALNYPVFIVDENSKDGTIQKAKKLGVEVFQRECLGKGCGVIKGFKVAKEKGFDTLVLIDCDMTYPIEMIPTLLKESKKFDMVVGARPMKSIVFVHRMGNIIHSILINLLYGAKLTDVNSGLRVMKVKDFYKKLDAKGFDIEVDITIKALKQKLKIKEIPINYKERLGVSKILWVDGIKILLKIIKERFI